jgi:hypothetical protein
MRTRANVEYAVTAQSTIHLDGSCVVPTTVDIDGLSLTPSKIGLAIGAQPKHELLYPGYVGQWESFRADVISRLFFLTSLLMHVSSFGSPYSWRL